MQGIFVFMWANYEPLTYNRTYSYPSWALAVGMCMAFASMACVPAYVGGSLLFASGTFKEVFIVDKIRKRCAIITVGLPGDHAHFLFCYTYRHF